MNIKYSGNNSGGYYWTTEEDSNNLKKAGWKPTRTGIEGFFVDCEKEFKTVKEAIEEFEKITGQDVSAEGCNCCGPPHSFKWKDGEGNFCYCSGEGCLEYMFPDKKIPKSLRESLEESE